MTPVTSLDTGRLEGRFIALEPIEATHRDGLIAAAADEDIWRFIPITGAAGFTKRFDWFLEQRAAGAMLPYAVRRKSDNALVGSTSYRAISPENARVEIGFTWYRADAQGSAVNPEAKCLLLGNAFASRYNRVEFKTDAKNTRSRAALAKLGAREEGILRGHMWMPQGYFRDSVYFSILAAEWPAVKTGLERRLAGFAPKP